MAISSLGVAAALAVLAPSASAAPVKTDHVTAELVAERQAVRPGETIRLGLRMQHIPHWHTYWRNPGDSGLPTTLTWQLPAGASAAAIDWPAPVRLPIGPLVNYGYEGDLLLPLVFTAPADARPGDTLALRAQANWLVCKDVCIPESAALQLQLPVAGAAGAVEPSRHAAQFARAATHAAAPLNGWNAELQQAGRELLLLLTRADGRPAAPAALPPVEVFPYTEQLIDPARHKAYRTPQGYAVKLTLLDNVEPPARFEGIAVARGASPWADRAGPSAEFGAAVRSVAAIALPAGAVKLDPAPGGAAAATTAAATRSPLWSAAGAAAGAVAGTGITAATSLAGGGADLGLWAALALAFVGGMVLNLMPCVFPVLSIKLLSLAQQGEAPAGLRRHALFYTGGVVLTFLALAAILLGLRAAGSAVGWGFQLQEPGVVFVLALLFFGLGLNLIGAFEFRNLCPQRLLALRSRHPAIDAFAAGMLAVLAASPCTAPFMGAALGFAVTQSPAAALAVFGVLGLGMALPYAALVLLPGWRSRLPRPGPWMLRLKQALAFPMFATVVWLLWVLGLQAGVDGVAKALLALVAAAFVVWAADALASGEGRGGGRSGGWRRLGGAALALALSATLVWSWPQSESRVATDATGAVSTTSATAPGWAPYDEAVLAQHVAAGTPVFVDFTAAWCVSCQVNKRLVLQRDDTMAAFASARVTLMRADWTHRDAGITAALARLGRNGVPVYVLIRPGREPLLLPEILSAGAVRDALATL